MYWSVYGLYMSVSLKTVSKHLEGPYHLYLVQEGPSSQ